MIIALIFIAINLPAQHVAENPAHAMIRQDTSMRLAYIEFIVGISDEFNFGLMPEEIADPDVLADSLDREKISYMLTQYTLSGRGLTASDQGCICTEIIKHNRQVPFIRYCIEPTKNRFLRLTVVQGCNSN